MWLKALSAVCGAGTAWERGYGYAATARSAPGGENWKSTSVEQLADRQQMSRAFAAEFLVLHEMLRRDLSGSWVTEEESMILPPSMVCLRL